MTLDELSAIAHAYNPYDNLLEIHCPVSPHELPPGGSVDDLIIGQLKDAILSVEADDQQMRLAEYYLTLAAVEILGIAEGLQRARAELAIVSPAQLAARGILESDLLSIAWVELRPPRNMGEGDHVLAVEVGTGFPTREELSEAGDPACGVSTPGTTPS